MPYEVTVITPGEPDTDRPRRADAATVRSLVADAAENGRILRIRPYRDSPTVADLAPSSGPRP